MGEGFTVGGPCWQATVVLRHAEVLEDSESWVSDRCVMQRPPTGTPFEDRGPNPGSQHSPSTAFATSKWRVGPGRLDPEKVQSGRAAFRLRADRDVLLLKRAPEPSARERWSGGCAGNSWASPTDCPQRDERLGWTGDLQVFAPTAAFLYDVAGFVTDWLADLRAGTGRRRACPAQWCQSDLWVRW